MKVHLQPVSPTNPDCCRFSGICLLKSHYSVYGIEQFQRLCDSLAGALVVTWDVTLERRIRELCAQAVAARDAHELQPILSELNDSLREHTQRLKSMFDEYPFSPRNINKPAA